MSIELKTASGGSVTLVPQDGGGNFSVNIKNADGTLLLNEDFDQKSLAHHGYQVLPSGLIIQWGICPDNNGTQATQTLPIAFPNTFLCVVISQRGTSVSPRSFAAAPISKSEFVYITTAGAGLGSHYIAIGS